MQRPDPGKIAATTLWEIIKSPIVFIPYATAAASFIWLPTWASGTLTALVTFSELAYWKKNWKYIYRREEFNALALYCFSSNEKMKREISRAISGNAAFDLISAIELKEKIERKIFQDREISEEEQEILDMLEDLLAQIISTAKTDDSPEAEAEIQTALATLKELDSNLVAITAPVEFSEAKDEENQPSGLASITAQLAERVETAQEVQRVLESLKRGKTTQTTTKIPAGEPEEKPQTKEKTQAKITA